MPYIKPTIFSTALTVFTSLFFLQIGLIGFVEAKAETTKNNIYKKDNTNKNKNNKNKGNKMADSTNNLMVMELATGQVKIKLREDLAPKHTARIKTLIEDKFYDGLIFHRVIEGFMAQTGDPTGTGSGGSDYPDLRAEFSDAPFKRGTVGMARAEHPDSGNSQFFICFDDASFLNGQYTVFGEVIEGMEYVDKIAKGEPPAKPDKIISLRLAP